jgi:peptide/nickel transport system ATP-binding protein
MPRGSGEAGIGRQEEQDVEPLLQIEDLHTEVRLKNSVVRAVDGVSIHIDANEMLGLVGESGCGKTMTALSVIRLLPPGGRIAAGSIRLNGRELTTLSGDEIRHVRGNEIGMVFQDPLTSLNPTMTIGKQISQAVLLHHDVSRAEAAERAVEVLDLVGLPHAGERAGQYPHQCSGGIRQRVMIAMALSCEPRLLIADEPTTALDVSIQEQILELIDDLRARLGMAVLLVTHDLGVVAGRADRVVVMYAGKVAETAGTQALFERPRHPYTEALFEALPERAAGTGERLYSIPGMPPDLTQPPGGCRFAPRCRYAAPRCRAEEPQLDGEEAGHRYACFYPVGGPQQAPGGAVDDTGSASPTRTPAGSAPAGRMPAGSAGNSGPSTSGASPDHAVPAAGTAPLLSVQRLVKDFAVTRGAVLQRRTGHLSAVAGVSFDVRGGETFGLVGESGCGKTTIGRLIVGLETPTSGAIVFNGSHQIGLSGAAYRRGRRHVQLMFQDSYASMDPRMRVGPILREPLAVQRIGDRAGQQRRVRELLDQVGLPASALERYPHEFSGGQRQRLALARALTLQPKLVIADEPVSAMDVSIQAQILNLMQDLQRDLGLTYVLISHDLAVVRYLANHIGVMYLGKLVEVGQADDVYLRPAHPYTKGLIDSAPAPDPEAERRRKRAAIKGELPSAIHPPSGCRFRTRCPLAEQVCAEAEPPLRPLGPGGHLAACHFPLQPAAAARDSSAAGTRSATEGSNPAPSHLGALCGLTYCWVRQRQTRMKVWAAMVAAVRVSRPQKLWAPWRASSIWSVISAKVVSTRLRHSEMIFSRAGGMLARWRLAGGTSTAVPRAAWAAANALPAKPLSTSRSAGGGPVLSRPVATSRSLTAAGTMPQARTTGCRGRF